jgi:hypothetical protein
VILYAEMRLKMPQNSSKLKFCFNVFVNIFQCYSRHKGSRMLWLQCKQLGDIIQNNFFFYDFCVVMRLQMVENFSKQTEHV